jgi:PIN domain nuclease of toxin-antitoxin system
LLPRFLLDTHVAVRWLLEAKKLSREQVRAIEEAVRRTEPVGLSAMSLLEIAVLTSQGKLRLRVDEFFEELQANPLFRILPLSYEVALEVASLGVALRDPADRVIVATARVHRLRLMTLDQRIIESKLVPVLV